MDGKGSPRSSKLPPKTHQALASMQRAIEIGTGVTWLSFLRDLMGF